MAIVIKKARNGQPECDEKRRDQLRVGSRRAARSGNGWLSALRLPGPGSLSGRIRRSASYFVLACHFPVSGTSNGSVLGGAGRGSGSAGSWDLTTEMRFPLEKSNSLPFPPVGRVRRRASSLGAGRDRAPETRKPWMTPRAAPADLGRDREKSHDPGLAVRPRRTQAGDVNWHGMAYWQRRQQPGPTVHGRRASAPTGPPGNCRQSEGKGSSKRRWRAQRFGNNDSSRRLPAPPDVAITGPGLGMAGARRTGVGPCA
ncbi:hypothetical protein BDY21DRAFT_419650 [Lineolata rhizophorae]|uniref:Uncharacterized protein n=1 Tax=Lineolata rhizophorae TaxID=578093 RepID=A0A6A6P844_9PEZI|nr:hypothetical protein BDY21DRAFT_419650 [Lineolata rhizophorae]